MTDKSEERQTERMKRWRNVMCPESEPDSEVRDIDKIEDAIGQLPPLVERIRALISRIDPLSHYKAFENVDFLLNAIGNLDYPRSPAVDVLWRHGQIEDLRRTEVKKYIDGIDAWLSGYDLEQAANKLPQNKSVTEKIYAALGEMDENKRWLAMCLRKTLKEHTYSPWDFINESDDETYVRSVYLAILHRPPSPDDLKFRLEELQNGVSRESFFQEIMSAGEHQMAHLYRLAEIIKQ